MQLDDQAEVHQPNPARDGDEIEVKMWMRASETNATAEITIDFRNQEMWTAPIESETWITELDAEWTQYTFSATAPIGASRPVFHTRLTIQNDDGEPISVDDIEMKTTSL